MSTEHPSQQLRLCSWGQAGKPNQHDTYVNAAQAEDQFAEVLVGGEKQYRARVGLGKHYIIGCTRSQFGRVSDLVPVAA